MKKLFFIGSLLLSLTAFASQNQADDMLKQAMDLWLNNDIEAAEEKLKATISEFPEHKKAYARLAALYLSQNKFDEAISAYQDAISHDPKNARLFASISMAYLHQSKYKMAQAMVSEALRLEPELKQAENLRKYIEAKLKTLSEEQKAFEHPPMPKENNG